MPGRTPGSCNPVEQEARRWLEREQRAGPLDDAARAELAHWLAHDSLHRKTYARACQEWQLAGTVPARPTARSRGHEPG